MPKSHPRRYRIESLILEALAPMIASALPLGIITVRSISLNKDFSVATVIYSTAGTTDATDNPNTDNSKTQQTTQQTLEETAWRFRRKLALALNMRKTPKLVFVHDDEGLAADKLRAFLENIPDHE